MGSRRSEKRGKKIVRLSRRGQLWATKRKWEVVC